MKHFALKNARQQYLRLASATAAAIAAEHGAHLCHPSGDCVTTAKVVTHGNFHMLAMSRRATKTIPSAVT